jgi:hypothetical protein
MAIVPNNQSFDPLSSSALVPALVSQFKIAMDTVLQGGRNITIHLPPIKSACPGNCRFNSSYKKFMGTNGGLCPMCRGEGFMLEQRQTIYMANIRQIKEPFENSEVDGQESNAGRVSEKIVRTKTVIESYDHVLSSIAATIDGEPYKLWMDPEKTGFGGTLLYVVTRWKKMDK